MGKKKEQKEGLCIWSNIRQMIFRILNFIKLIIKRLSFTLNIYHFKKRVDFV